MLAEGRVYGGGLHKLEPKELANVPAQALADRIPELSASSKDYTPYLQKRITGTP
jgi:hypothetical protein